MYSKTGSKMALKVSDYNFSKKKPVGRRPLENHTIYLDLKMYPGEANLSKNLKLLGAKVEPLFSRSVSLVVTNKDSARNALARPFKVPPKPQNWTPLTPITNTTCHSPLFLHESSTVYMDSPPYTNSPATDQNVVPMCRGMAMVKQAMLKKQSQGPTDILEKCRQWNVKVKHVDDILQKVNKWSQYIAQSDAEKKRTQNGERKLKPPFLKVEESKRHGTWYREFPSSTFDNKLADKVKELYNHFKKSGNIQVAIKPAQAEFSKNKFYPKSSMVPSPAPTQSFSKSISKFSETAKPSTAFSVCNVKRKISEQAPVASKKQKTSQGRKKKLYCEICKTNYVHLDKHLTSENHRIFMSDPMNFLEIQNIILNLPKKEDFLASRWLVSSDIGQISNEALLHSSQVTTYNLPVYYPQEYLNTCGLLDKEFTPQQFDLKGIVPSEMEDLDTEPYSVIDQYYVSPSCTSPNTTYLPYLEDSLDKVINESFARNDIDDTPLNLSNDGNRNFPNNCNQPSHFKCPENLSIRESAVETLPTNALSEDITLHSACTLNEVASMTENMLTVSNKRKIEEENLKYIPPIENPSNEFGNEVLHKDVNESKYSQQVPTVVEHTQEHCTRYFQCIDCTQENFFHPSQVNSALPEDKTFENPSFQEKIQNISNDSGISIRGSPLQFTLPDSLEEESDAARLKLDECCALDLSTTKSLDIEMVSNTVAPKPKSNLCEETSAMPELSEEVVDNVTISDQSCEMSVEVSMPPLSPVVRGKECETNAVIIGTFGNPGDLQMPNIACAMECEASSQDASQTTIVVCEQVLSGTQNITNEPAVECGSTEHQEISKDLHLSEREFSEHNADSPTEIACETVSNEGINQAKSSSNGFEASITVDIGTFGDFKTQHTLHGSEYEASLQNTSPFIHPTCEPSSEKQNRELEGVEIWPVSCKIEADAQNTDSSMDIVCERISTVHSIHRSNYIHQETICSKNRNEVNTVDIGTFGNSSCLDISNILRGCKSEDTALTIQNASSSTNATNQVIHIEPKIDEDAVICSINVKSEFVHLCEEVSKSFNGIGVDLNTSEVSCYELVEEAEFDSSSECEWDNIHSEVDYLCLSLCVENEDTDPFNMCS